MKKSARGFTLVELLVVIAIIAILAAVVVLIINPLELTRRGRDSTRLTDLANLQQAINVAVQEATDSGAAILCANTGSPGSYPCNGNSVSDSRDVDGTGWVRVNLSAASQSVSVPTLPVDPINSNGATGYHYTYCANNDAWEINARLESQQQQPKLASDGGDDDGYYEVGSAAGLNFVGNVTGCTY